MTASLTTRIFGHAFARAFAGGVLLLAMGSFHDAACAQAPADPAPPAATAPPAAPPVTASPPDTAPAPPANDPSANDPSANDPSASSPKKRNRFRIGPEIGVYLPTSSKARSQFGNTWLTVGLGIGSIGRVTTAGQTSFDLQVLYQSKNGNHAFLAPVGIGYRLALSQSASATPYVGATADVYFADLRSGDYDVHSGIRTGFGGSALAGVNFGDSGFLEARYLVVSRIKGFDLSGLDVTAGYRF